MNSQGWMRGMVAKNMETEKFIAYVVNGLQREFELEGSNLIKDEVAVITLGAYQIEIPLSEAKKGQSKGPYALDKYILEQLKIKGFDLDKMRSQYIRQSYGIFNEQNESTK